MGHHKGNGIAESVLYWSSFVYVLYTGFVWIFFYIPSIVMHTFMSVLFILYYYSRRKRYVSYKEGVCLILFILLAVLHALLEYPLWWINLLPAIFLFRLDAKTKQGLLAFITKWFGIVMSISISIFVLSNFMSLPSIGVVDPGLEYNYEPYDNYVFFLKSTKESWLNSIVYRFNGPFVEPGHLSMVCVFLMVANKFDFTSIYVKILFVSTLLSFSLAGYVLLALGWILTRSHSLKTLIVVLSIATTIVLGIVRFWGEENPISLMILSRLELDDTGHDIKGNNRYYGYNTDLVFEQQIQKNGLLFGIPKNKYTEWKERKVIGGAGYKLYFLQYGIISVILLFMLYFSFTIGYSDRRYVWGFLLMIAAAFLQRGYITAAAWMFPFICSCAYPSE